MSTASDVVANTATYISNAQNTANTAINNLNAAALGWTAVSFSAIANPGTGTYTQFAETDSAIATALSNLESLVAGTYTGFADGDATIKSALAAFDTALAAIPAPSNLPAAPSLAGYTAPVWSDTFWTNLKNGLSAYLTNVTGSDDVDTLVTKLTSETTKLQVALYAADLERKQQALRDANSAANAATGARGFTFPNSMTVALKLDAQQKYQFDLSQASRELVKLIFEWAKNNYQFSLQQGVAAHLADTDFNLRYADVLLRSFDAQVRNILETYRTTVAGEVSKAEQAVKSYTIRLEVARVNALIAEAADRTKLSKVEAKLKEYAQRLDVIKVNAGIVEGQDRVKAANYGADVQQHATNVTMAVQTAAANARNKIDAAMAAVNAAASMVSSASQTAIGILTGA